MRGLNGNGRIQGEGVMGEGVRRRKEWGEKRVRLQGDRKTKA